MSCTIDEVLAVTGNQPVLEALLSILKAGKALAARLFLTEEDLAAADAKAVEWLRD